jgi:hypothetical protein
MEREIEHRKIDECGNEDSTVIIIGCIGSCVSCNTRRQLENAGNTS